MILILNYFLQFKIGDITCSLSRILPHYQTWRTFLLWALSFTISKKLMTIDSSNFSTQMTKVEIVTAKVIVLPQTKIVLATAKIKAIIKTR
jgi:hypothetical protein